MKQGDLSSLFAFGAVLGAVDACLGGLLGRMFLAEKASRDGMNRGFLVVAVTVIFVSLLPMFDEQIGGGLVGYRSLIVGALCATRGVGRCPSRAAR
ncbi:hypothetical protein BKA00_002563 [Actinomadura coerulea]|uniref:Uncharacterized protein n=1 Tax=Actinomadura coerulea TaxID=46159 RepID=A0A7X0FXN3_9ACTN|nr:hypothetical protein [Actinomadura coerulea]MBB6395649.1 hypothetical protein [Actinomadura coerulea]